MGYSKGDVSFGPPSILCMIETKETIRSTVVCNTNAPNLICNFELYYHILIFYKSNIKFETSVYVCTKLLSSTCEILNPCTTKVSLILDGKQPNDDADVTEIKLLVMYRSKPTKIETIVFQSTEIRDTKSYPFSHRSFHKTYDHKTVEYKSRCNE